MKLSERIADQNSITALVDRLPPERSTQPFYGIICLRPSSDAELFMSRT